MSRSRLVNTVYALLLVFAGTTQAGTILLYENTGTCTALNGTQGWQVERSPNPDLTFPTSSSNGNPTFETRTYYDRWWTWSDPKTYQGECYDYRVTELANQPGGPPKGNTTFQQHPGESKADAVLRLIRPGKKRRPPNPDAERLNWFHNVTNPSGRLFNAGGIRGSLLGFSLFEQSPAYVGFNDYLNPLSVSEGVLIPFIVDNAGDGDWLSLSYEDVEFWRQPLSNFLEGDIYAAELPFSLVTDLDGQWSYFLESAGEANASVFFITSIVPIPPAVWLFGAGLLGLVGIARRKVA